MPEITKDKGQRTKTQDRIIWVLLAIAIIAVYFWGLNIPLLGPDEPRYAQVAREMFERGDWVTPKLAGFDWFEKPALLYWLQIASYKLLGVNEFAARFGSALFGLGTIFCLWILGKLVSSFSFQVSNEESSTSEIHKPETRNYANWLALIAASSIGLIVFSHAASFDIILTFPITASLVGFFLFDQSKEKSGFVFYLSLFAFYFFVGVALIAKGLVGIVFPFAIVAFYHVLSWKLASKTFVISLFWGTILSLLVASVWYLPMYQANGWKFIDDFFIQHHFQRYTSDKYQHPQPFWFFFAVLPLMTLPWLPFFLASIWKTGKSFFLFKSRTEENAPPSVHRSPLTVFAFAWMLVPLVFFSLSGSKLPGYILPALPAALILTANYVFRFVGNNSLRKFALQLAAAVVFVSVIVSLQFFVRNFTANDTVKDLIASADAQGFSESKILNFHITSHNAEFYAAQRLLRNDDGTQKRFDGATEIYEEIKQENKPVLVLTFPESVGYLNESGLLNTKVLSDNGDLTIVAVEKK